ncbi:MAG: hypothetical protein E7560_02165 [Ruminococcaceae bacterium]|nr:hypothetical protein [Oscillospiraceae bacterium]
MKTFFKSATTICLCLSLLLNFLIFGTSSVEALTIKAEKGKLTGSIQFLFNTQIKFDAYPNATAYGAEVYRTDKGEDSKVDIIFDSINNTTVGISNLSFYNIDKTFTFKPYVIINQEKIYAGTFTSSYLEWLISRKDNVKYYTEINNILDSFASIKNSTLYDEQFFNLGYAPEGNWVATNPLSEGNGEFGLSATPIQGSMVKGIIQINLNIPHTENGYTGALVYKDGNLIGEVKYDYNDISAITIGNIAFTNLAKQFTIIPYTFSNTTQSHTFGREIKVSYADFLTYALNNGSEKVKSEAYIICKMYKSAYGIDICKLSTDYEDDALEYIKISSEEELYAVSRILASKNSKNKYIKADSTYNINDDFAKFDIPKELNTDEEKILYFASANYKLTKNLNMVYNKGKGKNYFLGIGSNNYPFSGTFNGNNHTIRLSMNGSFAADAWTESYMGFINRAKNATIKNLNINISNDILLTDSYVELALAGFIGYAQDTTVDGCSLTLNNADFGLLMSNINSNRKYAWVAGIIGVANDSTTIKNTHITLTNSNFILKEENTSQKTNNQMGCFVGRTKGSVDKRVSISDCSLAAANSNISNLTQHYASTGAIVGYAIYTDINNCRISLKNSCIKSYGEEVCNTADYSVLSTGGMIGFSDPGSNNTTNIGTVGNKISNSAFVSNNISQQDVVCSVIKSGSEVTAGGLVGCSYNNFVVEDSSVDIIKGNITAMKTGQTDSTKKGTQSGGIIGRLEHTGEVNNCKVKGDYLNIISKSPENYNSAGGIVGIDVGPYHKNIATINNCSFEGNNTSNIIVETICDDTINKYSSVGGIAGYGTYKINNCSVKNVTIIAKTLNVEKCYAGKIAGLFVEKSGLFASKTYFVPATPQISNCTTDNVVFDVTSNTLIGETKGFSQ